MVENFRAVCACRESSEMRLVLATLAALGLLGTLCASEAVSDVTEDVGVIIKHIKELAPVWLAMMLVVSAACELKAKKPVDEGPPWSLVGVAR